MKPNIVLAASAIASLIAANALAAGVSSGDLLTIDPAVEVTDDSSAGYHFGPGSYFGMDLNSNSKISTFEKTPLGPGFQGGLVIGTTTAPGASHGPTPSPIDPQYSTCSTAGDSNAITTPWCFAGGVGSDYLVTPVTGSTEAGLDFSGWRSTWNGNTTFDWSSGAWGTGFADGVGQFVWDGVYGHSYTLRYHATVPQDDPSGFGGVHYELFLTGVVRPVPEAEAWALLLAGLGLVGAMTRRRRLATSPPRPHAGE